MACMKRKICFPIFMGIKKQLTFINYSNKFNYQFNMIIHRERRTAPVPREMSDHRETKPRQGFAENVDGYQGYDGYSEPRSETYPRTNKFSGHPRADTEYSDAHYPDTDPYPDPYSDSHPEEYNRQGYDYDRGPETQGGFKSRGRFDMSYPDERDGRFPQREAREVREGDWTCTQCLFSNFASRTSCYKCQKEKGDAPETMSLKNWECTECFASNHERRFDCFKCQKPKPKNAKECAKLEDWNCPGCKCNNNARRTNCARCDAARPGREKELEQNPDWKCGGCGIMNWSWRTSCYKCQAGKEDGKIPEGVEQDWECGECGKSNWARRVQCYVCKAKK